jgi:hypothetical protein
MHNQMVMANYANTKTKGNAAELEALCFFNRRGYTVSLPFGENAPYDLVVESPSGRLYRLQVRWASWNNGVMNVSLRRSSGGSNEPLDVSRIDAFVAWDGETAFVIPVFDMKGHRAGFSLRREPSKNGQKKGVTLASVYSEAIHLLP